MLGKGTRERSPKERFFMYFFLLVLACGVGRAQHLEVKEFDAESIEFIQMEWHQSYAVEVYTHSGNKIQLELRSDGEYQDRLTVDARLEGNLAVFSLSEVPGWTTPNDKLSAHKVVASSVVVGIPEGKWLDLRGGSTQMDISGNFERLVVKNADRDIYLKDVKAITGEIFSQSGTVYIQDSPCAILQKKAGGALQVSGCRSKGPCEIRVEVKEEAINCDMQK